METVGAAVLQTPEQLGLQAMLKQAMNDAKPKLEREHTVRISEPAVYCAANLTRHHFSDHLSGRQLEEKAVDVLNRACLLLRDEISRGVDEKRLDELEYNLSRCLVESTELLRENPDCKKWLPRVNDEYKNVSTPLTQFMRKWKPIFRKANERSKALEPLIVELYQTRLAALPACIFSACRTGDFSDCRREFQQLDALATQIEGVLPTSYFVKEVMTLNAFHIGEVVSRLTGIPVPVLPNFGTEDILLLDRRLRERVANQDGAIDAIYRSIFKNGTLRPDVEKRPRASLLFLGPSGVGKTEVAKCIAEVFFRDADSLIRVNMSQYGKPHTLSMSGESSTGSMNEYQESGFEWLAESVAKKPHSLILFDKIEKSHLDVMEPLLLDMICGKLIDKDGHSSNLSKAIVIITSSVGAEKLIQRCTCSYAFRKQVKPRPDPFERMHECPLKKGPSERVLEEARNIFSPELLNSLDGIAVFDLLFSVENVTRLIMREKARIISEDRLIVYPSGYFLDVVSTNFYKQHGKSGKEVKSWLEKNVVPALLDIVKHMADKHYTVYIDTLVGTEKLSFRSENTNFSEEWMLKHFKTSFKKVMNIYQMEKAITDGILQLRNCISRLFNAIGDCKSQVDKCFVDTTMHIMGICCKMLHHFWRLMDPGCFVFSMFFRLRAFILFKLVLSVVILLGGVKQHNCQ